MSELENSTKASPIFKLKPDTGDFLVAKPIRAALNIKKSSEDEENILDQSINVDRLYNKNTVDQDLIESKISIIFDYLRDCISILEKATAEDDELERENFMAMYHQACFKLTYLMDFSERFEQFVTIVTSLAHEYVAKAYSREQISILRTVYDIARKDVDMSDANIAEVFRLLDKFKLKHTNPLKDLDF